jgi:hypothetical protein
MYSIFVLRNYLGSGSSKREINNDMLCPLAKLMASAARTPGLLSESKIVRPLRAVFGHFLSSEPTNTLINVIVSRLSRREAVPCMHYSRVPYCGHAQEEAFLSSLSCVIKNDMLCPLAKLMSSAQHKHQD